MVMVVHQVTKCVVAAKLPQTAKPQHWSLKSCLLALTCAQMAVMAPTASSVEQPRSVEVNAVTVEGTTATMWSQAVFLTMEVVVHQVTKCAAAANRPKRFEKESSWNNPWQRPNVF